MNHTLPRVDGFLRQDEAALGGHFLEHGYVIAPAADIAALDRLRAAMAEIAARHLGLGKPPDPGALLDDIHSRVEATALNALRLAVINGVNDLPWARRGPISNWPGPCLRPSSAMNCPCNGV